MTSRALRVQMLLPTLAVGGMETLAVRTARALLDRGVDARVTALEGLGPVADTARDIGVPTTYVPTHGVGANVRAPALIDHLRQTAPHVVHTHNSVWLKAARAARSARVPGVVHTFHGIVDDEPWYVHAMRGAAARYTHAIVAVSASLRDLLVTRAHIRSDRIDVILNGVNTDRFRPALPGEAERVRGELGIPPSAFLVGHVARLDPVKNQTMLLHAFAQLLTTQPTAHLVIVGDGPRHAEVARLIGELGIGSHVHLLGSIPEPAPLYRSFDAFALSSTTEGTSMSILEAMASGTPVVATAVGGTPPLLDEGNAGLLVPSQDVEALARALDRLGEQPSQRAHYAAAGRSRVEGLFSEHAMLDSYCAIYERLARTT